MIALILGHVPNRSIDMLPQELNLAIAITRRCNKTCGFCYLLRRNEDLSAEHLCAALSRVALGHVSITGGEPLLHPELRDILSWLRPRCKSLYLLTNAVLLNDSWVAFFAANGVELFVSFPDGDTATLAAVRSAAAGGAKVSIQHVCTDGSVPVLRSLLALSDCVSSVILLYPVSLRKGAPRMYGWRRWRQLVATAVDTLAPFGGRLFYEPAFVPMESEKRQHPRCDARTVMFMDSDGLFYPCCFLPDVLAGSSVAEPRLCDPSYCPVLRRKVDHPSTVQRICPLVIRSSGSSSPFSPADIRVATSSSRRNSNGDTE